MMFALGAVNRSLGWAILSGEMRGLFILLAAAIAALGFPQAVRSDTALNLVKLKDVRRAAGFATSGEFVGTVAVAAFNGKHMAVSVIRSKGVDPTADLKVLQKAALNLDLPLADFNEEESKFANQVELDLSDYVIRRGSEFSGSVPIGKIAQELRDWKDLPQPIWVITAAKNSTIEGQSEKFRVRALGDIQADEVVHFRHNALQFGWFGIAVFALLACGLIVLPFWAVRKAKAVPVFRKEVQSLQDLKQRRQAQKGAGYFGLVWMVFQLPRLAGDILPSNPFADGLLFLFGANTPSPWHLFLGLPFLLAAGIGHMKVIEQKRRELPKQDETLKDRVDRKQLVSLLTFVGAIVLTMGLAGVLIATRARWSSLVPGVSPSLHLPIILGVSLAGYLFALLLFHRSRQQVSEPLPVGHRLYDVPHDAGRAAGVHVQQVNVAPHLDLVIKCFPGGNVILPEAIVNLFPDREARALIYEAVSRSRVRRLDYMVYGSLAICALAYFGSVRFFFTIGNTGFSFALVLFGVVGMLSLPLVVNWRLKASRMRIQEEALSLAVAETCDPDALLKGLARVELVHEGTPAPKAFVSSPPMPTSDKFDLIVRKAKELGLAITSEYPWETVQRDEQILEQEVVVKIRQMYDRWNARDIDAVLQCISEDCFWKADLDGPVIQGREGVRKFWDSLSREGRIRLVPVEFQEIAPDRFRILVDHERRDVAGRVVWAGPLNHIVVMREGLITEVNSEEWK